MRIPHLALKATKKEKKNENGNVSNILVINLLDGLLMLHVTFCLIPCCSDCGRGWTIPGQTVWKIRSLYMVANITRPLESEIQPEMDFWADKTDTISATMLGIYYKGPCRGQVKVGGGKIFAFSLCEFPCVPV